MGIFGLLKAVFQIALWYLKGKPERERIKRKEDFDQAIADGDSSRITLLFSKLHDRQSSNYSK